MDKLNKKINKIKKDIEIIDSHIAHLNMIIISFKDDIILSTESILHSKINNFMIQKQPNIHSNLNKLTWYTKYYKHQILMYNMERNVKNKLLKELSVNIINIDMDDILENIGTIV